MIALAPVSLAAMRMKQLPTTTKGIGEDDEGFQNGKGDVRKQSG